jgi:hypothetical protein
MGNAEGANRKCGIDEKHSAFAPSAFAHSPFAPSPFRIRHSRIRGIRAFPIPPSAFAIRGFVAFRIPARFNAPYLAHLFRENVQLDSRG